MNKTSLYISLFARKTVVLALFLAVQTNVPVALAAQSASSMAMDQSVENPGLLPTNPFYFLKSFVRNTQRAFTVSPVKRADLELDILSQKAGELKKLEEVLDGSDENLKAATVPYGESVDRLHSILQTLKETSKNQATNQLLSRLLETGINHMMIFDALQSLSDVDMKDRLESLDDRLSGVLANTLERLDSNESLQSRISSSVGNQKGDLINEMMLVRALSRIEDRLSDDADLRSAFLIQKDHMLFNLIANLQSDSNASMAANIFDSLPGNSLRTILLIDELRERVGDSVLKNTLTIVRQRLVDVSKESKSVSKPEAGKMLDEANRLVRVATDRGAGVKSSSATQLISRAKFNATQADASFKIGQYGDAAWQATASIAASRNALSYFARNNRLALEQEVKSLKAVHDSFVRLALENGVSQDSAPQIVLLLAQCEKALSATADLIGDKINLDKTVSAMRDANLLVEKAGVALEDLSRRIEEASAAKRAAKPLIERVLPFNDNSEQEIKKEAIMEVQRAAGN